MRVACQVKGRQKHRARRTLSEGLVEIAWLLAQYARHMSRKDARFKRFVGEFSRIAKAFGRVAAKHRGK